MRGRRLQPHDNRARPRVNRESLDRRVLRRVDVAGRAEIARVTHRAADRDRAARPARQGTVACAREKAGLTVRRRDGERRDVRRGEPRGARERHVACLTRRIQRQVGRAGLVTLETAVGRGTAHRHPRLARRDVAVAACQHLRP